VLETNLKKARADCPLVEVDYLWIDRHCDEFKARPLCGKDKKKRRMSPNTVSTILRYLRLFFVWLDDSGYGGWKAPAKLHKPFRLRLDDLRTPSEMQAANSIKQFTVEELCHLYQAAKKPMRQLMLAALFCGFTQMELSVLEKSEFDLDAARLHHYRNKTKVEGTYWLPPELVELLRENFQARADDTMAFRSSTGGPLITVREGRPTSDAVRQAWDDLRKAAGLPGALSFKYLRKYLANWMDRHGGERMGQIALAHRPATVLGKFYTSERDFERFQQLQRQMYEDLKGVGLFSPPELRQHAA
jgi:integrase